MSNFSPKLLEPLPSVDDSVADKPPRHLSFSSSQELVDVHLMDNNLPLLVHRTCDTELARPFRVHRCPRPSPPHPDAAGDRSHHPRLPRAAPHRPDLAAVAESLRRRLSHRLELPPSTPTTTM